MAPKKKKKAGPPPVFATSSVKSKKNIEDEQKAEDDAKKEEDEGGEEENSTSNSVGNSVSVSGAVTGTNNNLKTESGPDKNSSGESAANSKSKGHAAAGNSGAAGSSSTNAPGPTTSDPLLDKNSFQYHLTLREKEEVTKLSAGHSATNIKPWNYLKPAGAVVLSNEVEEMLWRNVSGVKGDGSSSITFNSTSSSSSSSVGTTVQKTLSLAKTESSTANSSTISNILHSLPDPISTSIYFPDAWRLPSYSKSLLPFEKLNQIYLDLQQMGFSDGQIERAMRATVGYDMRAALEYLVLTHSDLPTVTGSEGSGDGLVIDSEILPDIFRSETAERAVAEKKRKLAMERAEREEEERKKKG